MADRTINDLTAMAQSAMAGGVPFPVWNSGTLEARKATLSQIAAAIGASEATSLKDHPHNAAGDGSTDDSAAMASALSTGGVILVPAGTYDVTSMAAQNVNTDLTLIGVAPDACIINVPSGDFIRPFAAIRLFNLTFQGTGRSGDIIDFTNTNTPISIIEMVNCKFDNINIAANWKPGHAAGGRLDRFICDHCSFTTLGEAAAILRGQDGAGNRLYDAQVTNNYVNDSKVMGFQVGFIRNDGSGGTIDDYARYIFTGNIIRNVDAVATGGAVSVGGIRTHGQYIIMANNIIDTVTSADGIDVIGLYCKAQHAQITGNICVDCGMANGFIDLKGSGRTGSSTAQGHNYVCANNVLRNTRSGGVFDDIRGIFVGTDEVIIANNIFEGFNGPHVIKLNQDGRNITVQGNKFANCVCTVGIIRAGNGISNIIIDGNIFDQSFGAGDIINTTDKGAGDNLFHLCIRNNVLGGTYNGIFANLETTGGTFADIEIIDNLIGDAATGVLLNANGGDINRVFIHGNNFAGVATPVQESGASNVLNKLYRDNRGLADVG